MSVHGMIEERLKGILADALAPLVARLEALEKQLQTTEPASGEVRTAEPGQSLPPVQYAQGGFTTGIRGAAPAEETEPLPEETKPVRKRAPRKTTPDA